MGYLFALAVSLVGYGIFRSMREDTPRGAADAPRDRPAGLIVGVIGLLLWAIGGYYAADYAVGTGLPLAVLDRADPARALLPALLVADARGQDARRVRRRRRIRSRPRPRAGTARVTHARAVPSPPVRRPAAATRSRCCSPRTGARTTRRGRSHARPPSAGHGPVAVVTIAKIYGSSFGLPHPGLLPDESGADRASRLGGGRGPDSAADGVAADGQVAATRRSAKKLAAVARARGARVIVIDETDGHESASAA